MTLGGDSLTSYWGREGLPLPVGGGEKFGCLAFVLFMSSKGVSLLFREQETYYHYKEDLAAGPAGLVVSAKKGSVVNRW